MIVKRAATARDNLGLAAKVASKFVKGGNLEDSPEFSDACLGLVYAEKKFNKERINEKTGQPTKFSTYAYRCAYNEVIRGWKIRKRSKEFQFVGFAPVITNEENLAAKENTMENLEDIYEVLLSDLDLQERYLNIFIAFLHNASQADLASEYGISRERIRQIIFEIVIPRIRERHATFIQKL